MQKSILQPVLSTRHSHPRDKNLHFDEPTHKYTILTDPDSSYTSVTTWNHSHFSHFDADAVIDKMMKGKNWNDPTYKYYGMTREEIKKMWDKKRDESSGSGTKMHNDIEKYYNDVSFENDSLEFSFFRQFLSKCPGWWQYLHSLRSSLPFPLLL